MFAKSNGIELYLRKFYTYVFQRFVYYILFNIFHLSMNMYKKHCSRFIHRLTSVYCSVMPYVSLLYCFVFVSKLKVFSQHVWLIDFRLTLHATIYWINLHIINLLTFLILCPNRFSRKLDVIHSVQSVTWKEGNISPLLVL